MPASPTGIQPIVFDGDWTQAEAHLIASAIKEAEANLQGDSPEPWICYCKRLGSTGAVYAAHRQGSARALATCAPVVLGLDVLMSGLEAD